MIHISNGNKKLGSVANISLPPIATCRPGVPCSKECYALKSYRMYKNVRTAWNDNLKAYKKDSIVYFHQINDYISKKQPRFFRWHVAGDIQDQAYLNNMSLIAKSNPYTSFLAFTKMYNLAFNGIPDNLQVIISAWPGLSLPRDNELPIAFMQDGSETRVYNAIECPGSCETCGMCFQLSKLNKNVVFYKH